MVNLQSWIGIGIGLLYFAYVSWKPQGLSFSTEQQCVVLLFLFTIGGLLLLGSSWNLGAPSFPVMLICEAIGQSIGVAAYYLLFPHVATYFGGWLVAPVRAGSDFSSLIVSLVGQAQYVDGKTVRFPYMYVCAAYATFAAVGLFTWIAIARLGIGLRKQEATEGEQDSDDLETAKAK